MFCGHLSNLNIYFFFVSKLHTVEHGKIAHIDERPKVNKYHRQRGTFELSNFIIVKHHSCHENAEKLWNVSLSLFRRCKIINHDEKNLVEAFWHNVWREMVAVKWNF